MILLDDKKHNPSLSRSHGLNSSDAIGKSWSFSSCSRFMYVVRPREKLLDVISIQRQELVKSVAMPFVPMFVSLLAEAKSDPRVVVTNLNWDELVLAERTLLAINENQSSSVVKVRVLSDS